MVAAMNLTGSEEPANPPGQPRPGLSARLRRLHSALNLPIATIALLVAVDTLVIVLGVLSLPPGLSQPAGSPSATPPATPTGLPAPSPTPTLPPGVQRVVIAHFAGSGADFDVARSIEGSLLAALASEGLSADVQVSPVARRIKCDGVLGHQPLARDEQMDAFGRAQ